ncbi:hypothetical protein Rhsp01_18660 [Rhizobium sp. NBRC 114257]|uniref:Uncharacterized protein n=1 Tax=Rhizobium dioscoreae TaxID=2653122 RepID=A0ABQ0Z145_9HYPH|nr:hypothetical protein RsS93_18620 [Rhizobium dioscoreae]GLU80690.1 hypothetical protein Rhsp01_18660 [Rhizobium sp. NBRC 114257]
MGRTIQLAHGYPEYDRKAAIFVSGARLEAVPSQFSRASGFAAAVVAETGRFLIDRFQSMSKFGGEIHEENQ